MLIDGRLSFLPRSATMAEIEITDDDGTGLQEFVVCLPLPLVQAVWRVGLAEVVPSTSSDALLVDQATRAASR